MHPNYYLSPLAIAVVLGFALPIQAAEPIALQKISFVVLKQKFRIPMPGLLKGASVSTNSLKSVQAHTDKNKVIHTRMQQMYAGFPVYGGYAIIHSKQSVAALANAKGDVQMNGTLYEGIQAELGKPDPTFIKNGFLVLEQFKSQYAGESLSEEQVTPMVLIDSHNQAHWAYKVSVFITHDNQIPERPIAIIDAKTNQTLAQWNDVKTQIVSVKGIGYGGNKKSGLSLFGKESPLLDITRNSTTKICYMENKDVKVIDMQHKYTSKNVAMKFSCIKDLGDETYSMFYTGYNADGYDRVNGAFSPTNDALYSGYVIKHMFHDWYGIEVLTKPDGSPMKLVMRVHYGENYENAYWDGRQMTFGDGDTMMYPLVSIGIGAHEISHGFTEQHSGLEYYGQSGGLNESFSDMTVQAAEFYSQGKSSWELGAEVMKEGSGYEALRFMDKPSRDGMSIDSADEYYEELDVHFSSGVFNRMFYLLSHQPNWDIRKAFDVMVKANLDYWTPFSSFEEAGCGILNAAQDLGFSLDLIKKSLDDVAVNYESCIVESNYKIAV